MSPLQSKDTLCRSISAMSTAWAPPGKKRNMPAIGSHMRRTRSGRSATGAVTSSRNDWAVSRTVMVVFLFSLLFVVISADA
ncbi:hypothetical protein [Candidatus Corynebacterium faecigallinarum]|uniref:hypothetical protein n=1 Tax=Candidatus Corynebacterium faecigallinarum TaxID=2838528 RepID=UPI003FCF7647